MEHPPLRLVQVKLIKYYAHYCHPKIDTITVLCPSLGLPPPLFPSCTFTWLNVSNENYKSTVQVCWTTLFLELACKSKKNCLCFSRSKMAKEMWQLQMMEQQFWSRCRFFILQPKWQVYVTTFLNGIQWFPLPVFSPGGTGSRFPCRWIGPVPIAVTMLQRS